MDSRKLGEILIDRKIINQSQLEHALGGQKLTGQFFGEILVGRGYCTEEQIAMALSEQLGFAYVEVQEMMIEPQVMTLIPKDMCLKFNVIPLYMSQNAMTVAMTNALDITAIDALQAKAKMRIRPVYACPTAIKKSIERNYANDSASGEQSGTQASSGSVGGGTAEASPNLTQAVNVENVIERVTEIIRKAVDMGASDIHLEPERGKMACRYRIDGILHAIQDIGLDEQAAIISRIKIMSDLDIAEKRLPQDGRSRVKVRNRDVDLRISTFPTINGENVVIRILDRSQKLLHLSDVGFSHSNLEAFLKLIHRPYGMILVAGPTGSGKTTTLYAALNEINTVQKNIITLEDPVEYELPNVRQSQINVKAGLTFANGLRSILRQDPDIIMIGEIRDKETAEIAIHAALTGHLVLSTIHTNDAPSGFTRLIDMGVEPFLVASSVIGILAQRLLRTLCPECKKEYHPNQELMSQLNLAQGMHQPEKLSQESGCFSCKNLGYLGRCGIFEMLVPNDKIKDLVTRKASALAIWEESVRSGMKTLRESGLERVIDGTTSVSELLRVTEDI